MTRRIKRHRTALTRHELSRPLRLALEDSLIEPGARVFDYGCGLGGDIERLCERGFECEGWDPVHRRHTTPVASDLVNLGYVVNVIEDPRERAEVLRKSWSLSEQVLVVSARLAIESRTAGDPCGDGIVTGRETFQKYFEQQELRSWIDDVLEVQSVPAAPGVFYIFRDNERRQSFLAARYRRQVATPRLRRSEVLFEQHRELFERLMEFIADRGRLPDDPELDVAEELKSLVGSIKKAFSVVRRVTDAEHWDKIRGERATDLLIYLGLIRFDGRPKFSQLPRDLQLDVKAFFSNYKRATEEADKLLFSVGNIALVSRVCEDSVVGKLTPTALYVHSSAVSALPPVLRIYEGCARGYIGAVEGANIVKLHRTKPQISYLAYPRFDEDPHPALSSSLAVELNTFRIRQMRYGDRNNPPILHRKEAFVSEDYPGRTKFVRLTAQEERAGLYEETQTIGTQAGWDEVLREKEVRLSGHRLIRAGS